MELIMPKHVPICTRLLMLTAVLCFAGVCRAQEFDSLLKKVPRSANVLVLMDTEALLKTPVAGQEGWGQKFEAQYVDRAIFVPPETRKLVLASHVDLINDFQADWSLALMAMSESLPMKAIARAEGGYVDTINGLTAAWAPSNAYFLETGPSELGAMAPANRQQVSRWANFAAGSAIVQVSPYLKQVADSVSDRSQIVMGIDLTDAVQPHRLDERLKAPDTPEIPGANHEQLMTLIPSLRGLTLRIGADTSVQGMVSVDFSEPVTLSPTAAKTLVLTALSQLGASIDAIENWDCEVTSTAIHLKGELDEESLRRVMSVIEMPSSKFSSLSETDVADTSEDEMAKKSLAYFKSITHLLEGLRPKTVGNSGGGGDGVWMDRYARKIDNLPILHVDAELLEYGSKLSETLRYMSVARKQSGVAGGVAASNTYANYSYGYNGDGYGYAGTAYGGLTATSNAVTAQKRGYQAQATNVRIEGWKLIDDATADIRRRMTQKYDLEF